MKYKEFKVIVKFISLIETYSTNIKFKINYEIIALIIILIYLILGHFLLDSSYIAHC